jgi:MFS family permease
VWIQTINQRIYYGWVVVAAILVILTFVTGLSFYNHAVILNALAKQPNFTVESASLAVSLFFLSGGFTGLWVAKLLNRFDPRVCISLGAILGGFALFSLAYVNEVWQLFCVYVVFGMGFAGSALIPATTLVTRWFRGKRAMALSIASTGLSLGGVIVTPLSATLVGRLGLATAAPILGVIYIVGVVPIAWLLLRPSPESLAIVPPARFEAPKISPPTSSEQNKTYSEDGHSFQQAIRIRFFWCFSSAYLFLMLAQVGGIAHQYGLARETLTESQTALAVAILPIASIIGRLIGGWIVDQVSMRTFAVVVMVMQVCALVTLGLGSGVLVLCIGLALFGSTVGNLLMLQPLLVSEAFGIREYARIFSVSNLLTSWGTAAGPWILGLVYGLSSNHYGSAYLVAAVAGLLGLLLFVSGGKVNQSL